MIAMFFFGGGGQLDVFFLGGDAFTFQIPEIEPWTSPAREHGSAAKTLARRLE